NGNGVIAGGEGWRGERAVAARYQVALHAGGNVPDGDGRVRNHRIRLIPHDAGNGANGCLRPRRRCHEKAKTGTDDARPSSHEVSFKDADYRRVAGDVKDK